MPQRFVFHRADVHHNHLSPIREDRSKFGSPSKDVIVSPVVVVVFRLSKACPRQALPSQSPSAKCHLLSLTSESVSPVRGNMVGES